MLSNFVKCSLCGRKFNIKQNTGFGLIICPQCHQLIFKGSRTNKFKMDTTGDQSISAGG